MKKIQFIAQLYVLWQKAIYSTKISAIMVWPFEYYAHFTSPIRRYPDIVVHRLLTDYLKGLKVSKEKLSIYEEISRKASEQEKFASDAERASINTNKLEYMSYRIAKVFEGNNQWNNRVGYLCGGNGNKM